MANYHLRDKTLSLKAKGLLSLMLSLPEDWDYTIFVCGNIHPTVPPEAKVLGNTSGIFQIVFPDFIFLRYSHGCWGKNSAFYHKSLPFMGGNFVIQ